MPFMWDNENKLAVGVRNSLVPALIFWACIIGVVLLYKC